MCGIAGRINLSNKPVFKDDIQRMLDMIKHRGPDDEGTFIENNIGLGHVRLSILDLSYAGHQPMFSQDKNIVVVFNGEIYNYLEIKKELQKYYSFKTKTDTEVIIAAYVKWGEDCLQHFNGDWAFVLYDIKNHKVFGARDRYGIKPFYYRIKDNSFFFASEVKSLVTEDNKENYRIIFDYLVYNRTDHTTETFFNGINKLEHGSKFTIYNGKISFSKWYELKDQIIPNNLSLQENTLKFNEIFKDSIALRLRSDVPIGVCLSGGLDSSAIVSYLMKNFNKKDINTFSAIYKGYNSVDESRFIDIFTPELLNMHYTKPTAETFFSDYLHFMKAQAEPVASVGPYAQYKVMELAKNHVKVTLDGQGADELLAGYEYFFGVFFKELLLKLNIIKLLKENYYYIKNHRSNTAFKYLLFYIIPVRYKNQLGKKISGNLSHVFFNEFNNISNIGSDLYNPRTLNESLYQHFESKLEHLLKWEDHNAMYFSIESRVPFLDHRLVEFLLGISSNQIINSGTTKYLLRESTKNVLPERIRTRSDKKGFSTPSDYWFRDKKFQEIIYDLLNSYEFNSRGIFDIRKCKSTYENHLSGKQNNSKEIWKWINLETWFRNYID
ncbi:MAG: asparagine synthase (glutamine-hydrolyzing) [Ignavibacteriaceae bacterium]|nr:asparagine synthase (glutamine-hydrolyzing) [Ignavibacteriaceae bacterium]